MPYTWVGIMNKRRTSIGVGLCSLMMIFTCLCLTIFASLSYLQAKRNLNQSNKIVESLVSYYQADYKASKLSEELLDKYNDEDFLNENDIEYNNGVYSFDISFSNNKCLYVSLSIDDGQINIERWQEVSKASGDYDYSGFVN